MSVSKFIEGDYFDILARHFFDKVVAPCKRQAYGVNLPVFRFKRQWDIHTITKNDKKKSKKKNTDDTNVNKITSNA